MQLQFFILFFFVMRIQFQNFQNYLVMQLQFLSRNYHGGQNDYRPAFFISTSNFGKMAILISQSELIMAFFGVKQRIGGYERGEERREKREERRRCGLRCNVLSRAVLSCAVENYIYIYIFICCSEALTFHNVFLCFM